MGDTDEEMQQAAGSGSTARLPSPPPSAYHDVQTPPAGTAQDLEAGVKQGEQLRQRGVSTPGPLVPGVPGHGHGRQPPRRHGRISLKSEREMRSLFSLEWAVFKKGIPPSRSPFFYLSLWVFMEWVHLTAHNYVYYLQGVVWGADGPPPPLKDLGLMLLADRLPARYEWIIGFATAVLCGLLLGLGLLRLVLNNVHWGGPQLEVVSGDGQRRTTIAMPGVIVLQRASQAMTVAMGLRVLTFMVTLLPNPADYCHGDSWDPPQSVLEIFSRIKFTGSCGDLLFSGHTSHGMVIMLAVIRYAPGVRFAKVLAIGSMILLCISLLAFKAHYSSDVLVAVYVNMMIWQLMPKDPVRLDLADLKLQNLLLPSSPAFSSSASSSFETGDGLVDETVENEEGRRRKEEGGEDQGQDVAEAALRRLEEGQQGQGQAE